MEQNVLKEAEGYVKSLFREQLPEEMYFHNLEHTQKVVEAAELIGKESGLGQQEMTLIKIAGWFHNTGYFFTRKGHEKSSENMAETFLRNHHAADHEIALVKKCIEATQLDEEAATLPQKVIKDADMYHLASPDFLEQSLSLRDEWKAANEQKLSKEKSLLDSLEFIAAHQYCSPYGKKVLEPKKQENIRKLKEAIRDLTEKKKEKALQNNKKSGAKAQGTARGIETMFRATARNQINLSAIADNKSNILISVNAIVLSVMITYIVRDADAITNLIFPVIAMVVTNLLTIIFAVIATLPNVTPGKYEQEEVENKKANLLFFGNFHNMKFNTYKEGVKAMMNDSEYLYSTLIRDQFELGVVLAGKYRKLRVAYFIFMFGLILTFLLFLIFSI
jgi:predicted metal-dependent HD superfamily phosphohydrolase